MLQSIGFENYKCFERAKVDIAPLTILCGVNSSGKSSIINSLLMMKQSYENNVMENNMSLNGAYIKCGSFEDISTNRNNNPIKFCVEYELSRPVKYGKEKGNRKSKTDIVGFKTLSKILLDTPNIEKILVKSTITLKKSSNSSGAQDNIVDEYNIILTPYVADQEQKKVSILLKHQQNKNYRIVIENIPNSVPKIELNSCVCYFENLTLINAYATSVRPKKTKIDGVLANIYLIFRINAMQFKNVKYLTPLRVYPQRNYIIENEMDSVGLGGEYTPQIMCKYAGKKIYGFIPPTEEKIQGVVKKMNFERLVNLWMEYLDLGKYSLNQASEMIKLNVGDYNISNVGFGVSQVLPILVSGLLEKGNELLMLEQPEIHLHPAAQMAIADFLLSMAIEKRGLIIETHSDHIINRIIKRVLQDKSGELNKMIKIYYVDHEKPITQILIDSQKGITNAPKQFFTQFGSESMKIAKIAMENYREGVKW